MRFGIAYKINLIVLLTVLVLGGTLGAFFAVEEDRGLRLALDTRVRLLGGQVAAHLAHELAREGGADVDGVLSSVRDPEVAYLFVRSRTGEVLGGRWSTEVRAGAAEYEFPILTVESRGPSPSPEAFGMIDAAPGSLPIGTLAIGIDLTALRALRTELLWRVLLATVGEAFLAAVLGTFMVRTILRRGMTPVLAGIKGVAGGDLAHRIPLGHRRDEFGDIGRAFNEMAARLTETLVTKGDLEATVARRTVELTEALAAKTRAQESVAEREAHVRLLLESTAEAIYGIGPDGLCTFCNPTCARLLGYASPEELIGRNVHALVHHSTAEGERLAESDCRIYQTFRDGQGYHSDDERLWRADGTSFPVELWSYPMIREGGVAGAVVTFLDLTERRRLEGELLTMRKLESLGVLAGGIAHDFNNLLMGILGNLSLAREELRNPVEAGELIRAAEQATLRTRALTQQLLTFSRGGVPVKKVLQVRPVVEDASRFALSGSSVRAEHDFANDLLPVEADAGQLGQVIHNLVLNAVQAMPHGGVIRISTANVVLRPEQVPSLPAGPYVRIQVADQGEGIRPEHLGRIFDPYFTTKAGGHGLGLATVYSIARKHGGHVTVASRRGEGTTFTVYLPATSRPLPAPPTAGDVPSAPRDRGRVLVMDDEPAVRKVAMTMLAKLGYEVDGAANGAEAVASVRDARGRGQPFDLLLMDLTVPGGMGGVEAMRQIRAFDPEVLGVATSGYSNDPVMAACEEYGFAGTVAKPYTVSDLTEAVARAMDARRPRAGVA
ncbi:MAG TPA: ATP-binding protein [Anaeromyxobacteraceae bacterium]|nr:ATP-binding protein [Anaeromyxobacteraceae bacterium]